MFCLSCSLLEKNVLFVQGTESVGCEKSCSYSSVQRDGSEPFQPA